MSSTTKPVKTDRLIQMFGSFDATLLFLLFSTFSNFIHMYEIQTFTEQVSREKNSLVDFLFC